MLGRSVLWRSPPTSTDLLQEEPIPNAIFSDRRTRRSLLPHSRRIMWRIETENTFFYSHGHRLAATLHKPTESFDSPWPVLVQGPGWLANRCSRVSEMFHSGFVEAGYAVFTFDYRGWGDSEGERGWIRPEDQIEDILSSITYVQSRPDLDSQRVSLWGIGGTGGGNAVYAGAVDNRVKCVIAQAVVADGADWLRSMRREYEWYEFLDRVEKNRVRRVVENKDEVVDPTEEIMVAIPERAAVGQPTYGKSIYLSSVESLLRYRPVDVVHRVSPRALLLTCLEGDAVAPQEHALALYGRAQPPKRLLRLRGVSHYDQFPHFKTYLLKEIIEWLDKYSVQEEVAAIETR